MIQPLYLNGFREYRPYSIIRRFVSFYGDPRLYISIHVNLYIYYLICDCSHLVQVTKQQAQQEQRLKSIEGLKFQIEQQKRRLEWLEDKKRELIVELKAILKEEERQKQNIPSITTPMPGSTENCK